MKCFFAIPRSTSWLLVIITTGGTGLFGQAHPSDRPNNAREFIQSSSPTQDGSVITSRSTHGGELQTFTTRSYSKTPTTGYQPQENWNPARLTTQPNVGQPIGYPYPRIAQTPTNTLGFEPIGNRLIQPTNFYQPHPIPQQPNCPTCAGGTSYLPTQGQPIFQNPVPSQIAPQPILPPGVQPAQPWLGGSNRVQYTPLISLRNLPPGTYLGQGVIGQPKAYVDGEPVRNLVRYILP